MGLGSKSGAPQRASWRNEASQWGWGLGRHGDEGGPSRAGSMAEAAGRCCSCSPSWPGTRSRTFLDSACPGAKRVVVRTE